MPHASDALKQLESLRLAFGPGDAERKLELLALLERGELRSAAQIFRIHEALLLLRTYPDDQRVLRAAERILAGFADREDLQHHRESLADSGIAGTAIQFAFYWPTACWLAKRCPEQLSIDWPAFDRQDGLAEILHLLFPYYETLVFEELGFSTRRWLETLKGPSETDASFLIHRFSKLSVAPAVRESLYDSLDVPIHIAPGPKTPSRTHERHQTAPVHFQTKPPSRKRYRTRAFIRSAKPRLRLLSSREGRRLIDLAKSAMSTRGRDLHGFMYANKNDVCLIDFEGSLQFVGMGLVPSARYVLESLYVLLILRNGVPIGYTQAAALFASAEINFNLFDTFRGVETSHIYVSILSAIRKLLGVNSFSVNPQQLGERNPEALKSGAWWFYYKHGFRPRDPDVRSVMRSELRKMGGNRRHRSTLRTLKQLATDYLHLFLDQPRQDIVSLLPIGEIGLTVTRSIANRFGADRETATRVCLREATQRLGLPSLAALGRDQRLAWERWSPLLLVLPGIDNWSVEDRRALIEVVNAKGARREADFAKRFDAHRTLQRSLLNLAAGEPPAAAK